MNQVIMSFSPVPSFVAPETPGPYDNQELGLMWLDWVAEFSADTIRRYDLVLMVPPKLELPDSVKAWAKVTRFPENQGISGWPQGPNKTFQQIHWFFIHRKLEGPFFWLEPDCIPVVPDWLDLIADEYRRGGKPFMGAIVEPDSHLQRIGRVPRHMTGNAVYPPDSYKLAPKIMEANATCWDVLAASEILPKCHPTTLIQHDWRRPEITTRRELSQILDKNTALFHSDKYGAIAKILRGQQEAPPRTREQGADMPIVDYAASRGVPVETAAPKPPSAIDDALELLQTEAGADPLIRKKIAKFMVLNDIVNHGHCTQYMKHFGGKKGAKYAEPRASARAPLSDDEFQNRIKSKSDAPASATTN